MNRKDILVIDDDRDLTQSLKAYFEARGFGVRTAHSGGDGMREIENARPDIILLDIMMDSDADGFNLAYKLKEDKEKGEIKQHYTDLGKQRFHEDIPLSDLVMTLLLIKRHLWIFVMENQFYDSSFELSRALELNNKVVLFFDRAIYFAVMGYEDEMRKVLKKAG